MRAVSANEGVGSSSTNVDVITVELRNSSGVLVNTTSTMLHTDGTASAVFSVTPNGSYYVVVKSRNAIETWSGVAQTLSGPTLSYDFTSSLSKAYGQNMKLLEAGVYGFYSGDLNQDGYVDIFDFRFMMELIKVVAPMMALMLCLISMVMGMWISLIFQFMTVIINIMCRRWRLRAHFQSFADWIVGLLD